MSRMQAEKEKGEIKMTAPTEQKGLFEQIKDQIDMHHCCNFPQQIEKICAEFEQRLAEAEKENERLDQQLKDGWMRITQTGIGELTIRSAEAERDKDRMEWLEEQFTLAAYPPDVGEVFHLWPGNGTVRAQIDAALIIQEQEQ